MQSALVFEPVWRILTRDKRASVSIKVGQESVQVIYVWRPGLELTTV
jgi:hypothetical protein